MCDLESEERKKRYTTLRKVGFTAAFCRRARDFSKNHFEWHLKNPTPWKDFEVKVKF